MTKVNFLLCDARNSSKFIAIKANLVMEPTIRDLRRWQRSRQSVVLSSQVCLPKIRFAISFRMTGRVQLKALNRSAPVPLIRSVLKLMTRLSKYFIMQCAIAFNDTLLCWYQMCLNFLLLLRSIILSLYRGYGGNGARVCSPNHSHP